MQYTIPKSVITSVIKSAREIEFPLEEVFRGNEVLSEWFKAASWSRNARPEFVLLSALGVTS